MSILPNFKKVKNYILTSNGYKLLSRWTSSETVEFSDGKTAEEKLGAINGIVKTYKEVMTSANASIVPSAAAVKEGFTWKRLGSTDITGSNAITLPESFNELCIKTNLDNKDDKDFNIIIPISIPYNFLQSEMQHYRSGYSYNATSCAVVCFDISATTLKLEHVWLNDEDVTQMTRWVAYYR